MRRRSHNARRLARVCATALLSAALLVAGGPARGEPAPSEPRLGVVSVAMLKYAEGKTSRCFAPKFLSLVGLRTQIQVDQAFAEVDLGSEDLFNHPFAIMTGEGAFALTTREIENLRDYLSRGGLLLASSGCSSPDWNASMRHAIDLLFPNQPLVDLAPEHEVFHTIFDIKELTTKNRSRAKIMGIELDGRLALVYSPEGLNDTEDATPGSGSTTITAPPDPTKPLYQRNPDPPASSKGCCCCGGNEVRDAKYFNANILAYALMK